MADDIQIRDKNAATVVLRATDNAGVATPHHIVATLEAGIPTPVGAAAPLPVSGPLTNTELRAEPVIVNTPMGGFTVLGPLTDAELRASAVPVSLPTAGMSAFGDQITAEMTPFVQSTAVYNRLPANMRTYSATGGSTTLSGGHFVCQTGTSVGGYGAIRSIRSVNYKGGMAARFRGTGLFTAGVANSIQGVGFFNVGDALCFGYYGTSFGIIHQYHGLQEVQTITVTGASGGSTNLTLTLNGTAYTIPLTAGTTAHNAFEIEQWLKANASATWNAFQNGSTVVVSATSDGAKAGAYSYSHATSTGTLTQVTAGVTKTTDFTAQADWNVDTASWLTDPTKGNIFQIDVPYLGYGNHLFYAYHPTRNRYELVHVIEWADANTQPSVGNPSMHCGVFAASLGSTTNLTTKSACIAAFIAGTPGRTRNPRAFRNLKNVGTTLTSLFTIRVRDNFGGKANQVEIEPLILTARTESSKGARGVIYANATVAGETNFSYLSETNLVTETSTAETTVSDGTPLLEFDITSGATVIDLTPLRIRMTPGGSITVAAQVNSGAASDISAALTWYEDL